MGHPATPASEAWASVRATLKDELCAAVRVDVVEALGQLPLHGGTRTRPESNS